MGSDNSFTFDLPQVITNLESIDTHIEEKNAAARIKVLEEYQRMLVTERKRRSIKEVIEVKEESADFKANLKKKRRSQRLGIIFKPNILPALATAGQIPPPNAASRMPQPNHASRMPQPNAASRMPQLLEQEPIVQDELMLEF